MYLRYFLHKRLTAKVQMSLNYLIISRPRMCVTFHCVVFVYNIFVLDIWKSDDSKTGDYRRQWRKYGGVGARFRAR